MPIPNSVSSQTATFECFCYYQTNILKHSLFLERT
jgi:hypothetical protein